MTVTADTLRALLRAQYPAPGWAFFEEVRNQTGYGKRERYADALVLGLWPSHGLEMLGFEIKVSRSDWKRELADPTKAAEFQKWCDRWFIVAPPGVVERIELPATWGLLELAPARANQKRLLESEEEVPPEKLKLRVAVAAEKLKPEPLDRRFIASLCRNINDGIDGIARKRADELFVADRERMTQLAENERARTQRQLDDANKSIEEVCRILGVSKFDLLRWGADTGERIKRALAFDRNSKAIARETNSLARQLRHLLSNVAEWEQVAQELSETETRAHSSPSAETESEPAVEGPRLLSAMWCPVNGTNGCRHKGPGGCVGMVCRDTQLGTHPALTFAHDTATGGGVVAEGGTGAAGGSAEPERE